MDWNRLPLKMYNICFKHKHENDKKYNVIIILYQTIKKLLKQLNGNPRKKNTFVSFEPS